MALTTGNAILASDFVSIKARVKAEMLRRNKVGSLTAYGAASYDYSVTPTAGGKILPEHWNKLITPMNAMVNTGLSTVSSGQKTIALNTLVNLLTTAEGYSITGNTTNCKSSCSGLCVGTCSTDCGTGCSGSCSGGCSGGCSAQCADNCSGGCTGECVNLCKGGCKTACTEGCAYTCNNNCSGGCKAACRATCSKVEGTTA